jgi:mannose-6-phosphate isomerase-like protein (cupin superfamily)
MAGYTITRLVDVPDELGDYPGEMQYLTRPLGNEQVAITYRRMPQNTGGKGSHGHHHRTQEEIYYVISGKLQFKVDDEVVELEGGSCIRVGKEVDRSIWNAEPEDGTLLIVSTRLPDSAPEDAVLVEDFWPE